MVEPDVFDLSGLLNKKRPAKNETAPTLPAPALPPVEKKTETTPARKKSFIPLWAKLWVVSYYINLSLLVFGTTFYAIGLYKDDNLSIFSGVGLIIAQWVYFAYVMPVLHGIDTSKKYLDG